MDEKYIETGEATQEALRQNALDAAAKIAIPSTDLIPWNYIRMTCKHCEDPLPALRVRKGRKHCTPCQTLAEKGLLR